MSHRIVRVYVEVQVQVHVQVHEYPQCQVCPAVSPHGRVYSLPPLRAYLLGVSVVKFLFFSRRFADK